MDNPVCPTLQFEGGSAEFGDVEQLVGPLREFPPYIFVMMGFRPYLRHRLIKSFNGAEVVVKILGFVHRFGTDVMYCHDPANDQILSFRGHELTSIVADASP